MQLIRTLAVTAAVGSVVVGFGTIPAQAATGYARCPANRFCVFTGTNGSGVMAYFNDIMGMVTEFGSGSSESEAS